MEDESIIEFCFNKNLLITHGPFDVSQPSFVLSQVAFAIWTFVSHILHRINTTWNKATRPTPKKIHYSLSERELKIQIKMKVIKS